MPRVIAIANQKGGAGKSTMAVNLAVAMGEGGRKRVLAIDLDQQHDLTALFGRSPSDAAATLYDVFIGSAEVGEATITGAAPNVDLVPGHERLADVEMTLVSQVRREEFLADALKEQIADYDLVLIDCPPNLGMLTTNALCAAPEVVVPVSMVDRNAFKGAAALLTTLAELRRKRVNVAVTAFVPNQVDPRRNTYQTLAEALPKLGVPITSTEIPMRAAFHDAGTEGVPVLLRAPDSEAACAYRKLAEELDGLAPAAAAVGRAA